VNGGTVLAVTLSVNGTHNLALHVSSLNLLGSISLIDARPRSDFRDLAG
jgi:hypothetical protein